MAFPLPQSRGPDSSRRRYNRKKKAHGGDRKSKDQIDTLIDTAEIIAAEHGISPATVMTVRVMGREQSCPFFLWAFIKWGQSGDKKRGSKKLRG